MTDITRNVGAANAGASTTRFYLSLDTVKDAADVLLTGARGIGPLSPGQFSTDTVTVFIPEWHAGRDVLPAGLRAMAWVRWRRPTRSNNCVASARDDELTLPTADLAVTAVSDPPATATPGAVFVVTDTTLNVGPITVARDHHAAVLSLDHGAARTASCWAVGGWGAGPRRAVGGQCVGDDSGGDGGGNDFLLACADDTAQVVGGQRGQQLPRRRGDHGRPVALPGQARLRLTRQIVECRIQPAAGSAGASARPRH